MAFCVRTRSRDTSPTPTEQPRKARRIVALRLVLALAWLALASVAALVTFVLVQAVRYHH